MKLTVLGGGGARSPFLAKSLACNAHRANLTEVVFQDASQNNLSLFGELSQQIFSGIRPDVRFRLTTDPVDALKQSHYIITAIREGGDEGRVRDERTALGLNVIGQETTGPGGFSMAMRSIPAILGYCRLVEAHAAADAVLFNFTNPSGLVTEAIIKSGFKRRVYGVCDATAGLMAALAPLLGCEAHELQPFCYGLNHLTWFPQIDLHGRPVMEKLLSMPDLYVKTPMQPFSPALVRLCGNQLLNGYLYYYYCREEALAALLAAKETRGEQIARINRDMRAELSGLKGAEDPQKVFAIWMKHYERRESREMQEQQDAAHTAPTLRQFLERPDGGGYAGVALDILEAVNSEETKRIVVSLPNNGTLDFLLPDDVVEVSCNLSKEGLQPLVPDHVPAAQKTIISCVKAYERLAVEAILTRSRDTAVQALMVHPLVGSWSLAVKLVNAYLDDPRHQDWK